jgi:hypothetical protein
MREQITDWTSRSTAIGRIYFDDENLHVLVVVIAFPKRLRAVFQ